MNVTFLIGNGFDLGIGLKTAYSDFYNVYCKSDSNDSLAVKKFKSEIQGNYENWSDFHGCAVPPPSRREAFALRPR